MRVLAAFPFILLAAASAADAPAAPQPQAVPPSGEIRLSSPDHCDRDGGVHTADAPGRVGARRLGDLPPGNLDLAVMRQIDGCPEPVTVAENFGTVEGPRAVRRPARTPVRPQARQLTR